MLDNRYNNFFRMKNYLIPLLLLFFLFSCDSKFEQSKYGMTVTGKVGEIMVVCENALWEKDVKAYLDTSLTRFIMPYFPDVATFELKQKTNKQFKDGNKRYRNLLFVELNSTLPVGKPKITKEEDVWANTQLVVRITANNYNDLIELLKGKIDGVHEAFDQIEWQRILLRFKSEKNALIAKQIENKFGINLELPKGSKIVTQRNNFYRIEFPTDTKPLEFIGGDGQMANFIQTGLLVYKYDFVDSSQLRLENLLAARDTILKYNVLHENKGIYMGTQYNKLVYPEGNISENYSKKIKGYEMRGMFQFLGKGNYSTGGAFWSFHFIHPKNKKIICVSGYVDAPSTLSWTLPLREIQAIWKSVEITK